MNAKELLGKKLYRRRAAEGKIAGPVVKIAIGAIALGVSVMLLALCIVDGFQNEIRAKVTGFGAHLVVNKIEANASYELSPIELDKALFGEIKSIKQVKNLQPFAQKAGILRKSNALEGILFKGVNSQYDWQFFKQYLTKGRVPEIADTGSRSSEIILSSYLASKLQVDVDSAIVAYFIQDPPKARKFIITGIFNTGIQEGGFDQLIVMGDIKQVQKLNNWNDNQMSGFEVNVNRFQDIAPAFDAVFDMIPMDWKVESIMDRFPQIFNWIELQDINVIIIIVLMLVVGIINMVTALLIMLLENTSLIGLLKSLGANNAFIQSLFLRMAFRMILLGLVIGNLLGLGLAFLQHQTHFLKLDSSSYYVSYVPIGFNPLQFLLLNLSVVVICLISMFLPLLIIRRFSPTEVLRYD